MMPSRRKYAFIAFFIFVIASTFLIGAWLNRSHQTERSKQAYVKGHVMDVTAPMEGRVLSIPTHSYQTVQAGDILFTLSDQSLKLELGIAVHDMKKGEAKYNQLKAEKDHLNTEIQLHEDQLHAAQDKIKQFRDLLDSYKSLKDGVISKVNMAKTAKDLADAKQSATKAKLDASNLQRKLKLIALDMDHEKIEYERLKLEVNKIEALIQQAIVRSPVDGKLGKVLVKPGQIVKAHDLLTLLFYDEDKWLIADFNEQQIKNLKVGQQVNITIDAYPNTVVKGVVKCFAPASLIEINQTPLPEQYGEAIRVKQKYPVVIDIIEPNTLQDKIRPGMSSTVSVNLNNIHEPEAELELKDK